MSVESPRAGDVRAPVLGVWRGEGLRLAYVLDTGMRFICARIKLRIKRMV